MEARGLHESSYQANIDMARIRYENYIHLLYHLTRWPDKYHDPNPHDLEAETDEIKIDGIDVLVPYWKDALLIELRATIQHTFLAFGLDPHFQPHEGSAEAQELTKVLSEVIQSADLSGVVPRMNTWHQYPASRPNPFTRLPHTLSKIYNRTHWKWFTDEELLAGEILHPKVAAYSKN